MKRVLLTVAGLLLAAALVLVAADTAAASRAERRISAHAGQALGLETAPEAYIGAFPFTLSALNGNLGTVSVSSLDVPIEGLGVVNTSVEVSGIEQQADAGHLFNGDVVGAHADLVRRSVRLDGVAFGELLGMTDLDISNPYDISPGGGAASEALLTGTVPGMQEPASVIVTLRLEGPHFYMRPSQLIQAPEGQAQAVLDAFSLQRDTRDLPLGAQADFVQLQGGSIVFSADRINTTVTESDLVPVPLSAGVTTL